MVVEMMVQTASHLDAIIVVDAVFVVLHPTPAQTPYSDLMATPTGTIVLPPLFLRVLEMMVPTVPLHNAAIIAGAT